MTTINDLNDDCLREIFLKIDLRERIKLREVSKKFCDIADSCWGEVIVVVISYAEVVDESELNSDDESEWVTDDETNDEQGLNGTHEIVRIRTSGHKLIEEVLKRCGKSVKTLIEHRHKGEESFVVCRDHAYTLQYCPQIYGLFACVITTHDDFYMKNLRFNIKKLKHLSLRIEFMTADRLFDEIPTNNLEVLMLMATASLDPYPVILDGQKRLFRRCLPSLMTDIRIDCFDDELLEIIGQMFKLTTLELKFYYDLSVTRNSLTHILKLSNLKKLFFVAKRGYKKNSNRYLPVTDNFFMSLGKNTPLLEVIEIGVPANVTDEGFKSLASLTKLKKLRINECDEITDEYLPLFSQLEQLDLTDCDNINDTGVIELLKKADTMRLLKLDHTSITNRTVKAAVRATKRRTNRIPLTLSIAGTRTSQRIAKKTSPLLTIIQ